MQPFSFTGEWEFELTIPGLEGFHSQDVYDPMTSEQVSDGVVTIQLEDELTDDPDPLPEQLAAINYLLENSEKIISAIYKRVKKEYKALKDIYDYEDEAAVFRKLKTVEDLKKVMGFGNIYISLAHKDGIAYTGYACSCNWDQEHGLGILMHKDRVISFGTSEEASDSDKAYEDNGTYEARKQARIEAWKSEKETKPTFYQPHPKYGKLKPSQESDNEMYENRLIELGYNTDFVALVETGITDINVNKGLHMSFLERASQFNNLEVVTYILSKKPQSIANAIQNAARNANKEMVEVLLAHGADINDLNNTNETPLMSVLSILNSDKFHHHLSVEERTKLEDMARWLVTKGANPYKKNTSGWNSFDMFRYQPPEIQAELTQLIKA